MWNCFEMNIKFWCIVGCINQYPMRVFYTYSLRNKFPNPNCKFTLWSAKNWSTNEALNDCNVCKHIPCYSWSTTFRQLSLKMALMNLWEFMCINMGKVPGLLSDYIRLSTFIYLCAFVYIDHNTRVLAWPKSTKWKNSRHMCKTKITQTHIYHYFLLVSFSHDGVISHSLASKSCQGHYNVPPPHILQHSSSLQCHNTTNMTCTNKMFH